MTHPYRLDPTLPSRLLPLAQAALLCVCAAPAWAQSAPAAADQPKEKLEEVVVTGSRIRGIAPAGASVISVSRKDIEASGALGTAALLQQVPQVLNLGVSDTSRGQSGGGGNITYASSVNLRGIGPYATLTLLNGHRLIGQGTGAATVDPNIIPSLALQRVEVVADGASAIYGSDAVAGVANLILRRNVDGAQGMVRLGSGDNYNERQIGALWGKTWAGGQATVTFENTYRSALSGRDRDFFRADLRDQGGGDYRSNQCHPGNIIINGTSYAIPAGGVTAANASDLVAGTANRCDNLKLQDLLPRQKRNSVALTLNQELPNGISLYADGFASRRDYQYNPAPLTANLTVPSTNPYYVRPPSAAAGTSETVAYSFVDEVPLNTFNGHSQTAQATLGADKALPGGWKAGTLYTYGYNEDVNLTERGVNNAALAAALNSTSLTTAFNPFGVNSASVLNAVTNSITRTFGRSLMQNYQLKGDGPLWAMPAGLVRAAVGYEGQQHSVVGGQTTGTWAAPVSGAVKLEREVNSVYGELQVPLFGGEYTAPGFRRLSLALAGRVDRYSDVGMTRNPKIGVNWSPVDSLNLRGSYGTSFRAPGLSQIRGFTNGGRGGLIVQNYFDPTTNSSRVGVVVLGANTELKPETAKTKTLGFDWDLPLPYKTRLNVTYFDITYDNQIVGFLSDTSILNREADFAGTGVITRNPSAELQAALLAQYPALGVPPAVGTWTLLIDGRSFNLSKSVSRGFDFQASTRVPTASMGAFALGVNGTLFTKYATATTPASAMTSQLNNIYNPMRLKARGAVNWTYEGWYASVFANFTNGYNNTLVTPVQHVSAATTVDTRVAYSFESEGLLKDTTMSLGVVNLFNKKPPFVNVAQSNNGGGGFDPTQVSAVGRIISVGLDKKF